MYAGAKPTKTDCHVIEKIASGVPVVRGLIGYAMGIRSGPNDLR